MADGDGSVETESTAYSYNSVLVYKLLARLLVLYSRLPVVYGRLQYKVACRAAHCISVYYSLYITSAVRTSSYY